MKRINNAKLLALLRGDSPINCRTLRRIHYGFGHGFGHGLGIGFGHGRVYIVTCRA